MKSVPIPGEILRTTMFLGLTFDELVTLGAVPLVVVFPTLFVEQIPLVASLGTILVSAVGVTAIVIRTPDGQTPVEWAPAALKRRFSPETYYLKPRIRNRDTVTYMNVVHTADRIAADANDTTTDTPTRTRAPTRVDFDDTQFEPIEATDSGTARADPDVTDTNDPDGGNTPRPVHSPDR